jgi:hypothetical protein
MNWISILAAAFIPLIIGFVWYNPKTLGNAWMKEAGLTEETMKGANMALIFGLTFVFSFFVAFSMQFLTIHQMAISSLLADDPNLYTPGSAANNRMNELMAEFGGKFRTFGHGAIHGLLAGIFLIFPIFAINALFERKSWKFIFINAGYWTLCFVIMGAIVCGWQ